MMIERTAQNDSVVHSGLWLRARIRWQRLDRNLRNLYVASFLIDLGLCLHFFMFSLFLVEHHFTERAIGFITATMTVGTIAGMMPISLLSKRLGLRTMMLIYIVVVPLCLASRVLFLQMPAQLGLAFLGGIGTGIWSLCFSPALSKLTTQKNRTFGFSLFAAMGIASSALSGIVGGYLPGFFLHIDWAGSHVDGIRIVLLLASVITGLALFAIYRLRLESIESGRKDNKIFSKSLGCFLVAYAAWTFSLSFFTPFANVYLFRHVGLPVTRIGAIFSLSQIMQVGAVLAAPLLYRRVGLVNGIALLQLGTASLLWELSRASGPQSSICIYLILTGLQWTAGPGLCSLLMNRTPEGQRSQAAGLQSIVGLIAQAGSTAMAGKLFGQYGYARPLAVNAGIAALAAVLLYALLKQGNPKTYQLQIPLADNPSGHVEDAISTST